MNAVAAASRRPASGAAPLAPWAASLLGLYLVVVTAAAGFGAYSTWPISNPSPQTQTAAEAPQPSAGHSDDQRAEEEKKTLKKEQYLIRFVLYLGVLGACLHAMTSMATYAGNKTFQKSWLIWYLMRPLIGGVLAWLVFLVFRGGFLGGANVEAMNPYAFGALGGLSGLFSKRVVDKLSELIDTLFRMPPGQGDDARANKAVASELSISAVSPDKLSEAKEKTRLTITGVGFTTRSEIEIDGVGFKPLTIGSTQLTADVPVEAYTGRKSVNLLVRVSGATGAISNVISLKVTA